MQYIAHSIPEEASDRKPHLYSKHILEVLTYGMAQLEHLLSFSSLLEKEKEQIRQTMTAVFMLHDMGKLDEANQEILRGEKTGRLPVDHIEAGVAVAASMQNELMGWLIRGHHSPGLASKKTEKFFIKQLNTEMAQNFSPTSLRGRRHKRSKADAQLKEDYQNHFKAIERTETKILEYKRVQKECCGEWPETLYHLPQSSLTSRLLLSCLVDADHQSTANYTQNIEMPNFKPTRTCWEKRLVALSQYVECLPNASQNERDKLRSLFYRHCLEIEPYTSKIVMCSAPVGLGKTTSVMAYLLRKSIENNASRVIVIAPFSNIIDQTVNTLRNSVVLENEEPEKIVAAHHHKVEFSDKSMRQYATLWQAPIIVTTAVQFFETLASSHPSKLRKLNAIAGASIFIDESHACLPVEFLKITWFWLKKLSEEWGCNIVFSSGSMVEFWNDSYMVGDQIQILPDLFPEDLKDKTQLYENKRIEFKKIDTCLSLSDFVSLVQSKDVWKEFLQSEKLSCLVILNTVQSCAVVADALARKLNDYVQENIRDKVVLHLSTALAFKDRYKILKEIERRQKESEWNTKTWYLIATSCVEAGVDLDFSIGFREKCSVTSFLQVAGRINRHGKRHTGILYDFSIIPDNGLNVHPGFKESAVVFDDLWNDLLLSDLSLTEISTAAQRKEFSRFPEKIKRRDLLVKEEEKLNFQEVAKIYKVINSDTATVIINKETVERLELGIPVSWQNIQENSVQLWMSKINKFKLKPIRNCSEDRVYSWVDTYEYDSNFLGIMGGILKLKYFFEQEGGVL